MTTRNLNSIRIVLFCATSSVIVSTILASPAHHRSRHNEPKVSINEDGLEMALVKKNGNWWFNLKDEEFEELPSTIKQKRKASNEMRDSSEFEVHVEDLQKNSTCPYTIQEDERHANCVIQHIKCKDKGNKCRHTKNCSKLNYICMQTYEMVHCGDIPMRRYSGCVCSLPNVIRDIPLHR